MPHFVKGLTDIEEGRTAVLFVFYCPVNYIGNAMYLFDGGMFSSESKLVIPYYLCGL